MRRQGLLPLVAVTVLAACSSHHQAHTHYAVMPTSALSKMMHQCSRRAPRAMDAWNPNDDVIAQLEHHLPQLSQQAIALGLLPANMGESDASFRQYQGIVVNGHQFVYINAMPFNDPLRPDTPSLDSEPMIVCDGGNAFWGAVYDPQAQTFSQLQGNGRCCGVDVPPPPPRPLDAMPIHATTSGTH